VLKVRDLTDGCSFQVRVQPRARRNAIVAEIEGALKISLTAPPVGGKANAACIEFLAKLLKAPKSSFSIAAGETTRNKVIHVRGISTDELRDRLQSNEKLITKRSK
jgi:uncharacterized protein (TIGR00251 family)